MQVSFFQNQMQEALAVVRKIQDMIKAGREPQEIAVLFRTNTGARIYLEKFMEYNIPFRMRDGLPNIYEHWIANDLFTYIRIAQGSRSRKDFLQIINRPKRYISREYLDTPVLTFEELRKKCRGRDWMEERIDRLEYDIASISRMKPFAAVNYIRHAVGYKNYLKNTHSSAGSNRKNCTIFWMNCRRRQKDLKALKPGLHIWKNIKKHFRKRAVTRNRREMQ